MQHDIYHAARIFDGESWHEDASLVVEEGRVAEIVAGQRGKALSGWIVPGLVDLQVNGGGGVLFNNDPSRAAIRQICAAHARFGTTASMVTLITDRPEITEAAIEAAKEAFDVAGYLGLHLEGPHLALSRKGTHDPALIRPMDAADLALLQAAAQSLPHLICTLAPEAVQADQITALAAAGAVVSLGHSDTSAEGAAAAFGAGARMVTHLYNAMSQMSHRAPGLVGRALADPSAMLGIIADGFHVDPIALKVAMAAAAGRVFLVSDAMSTIGTDLTGFTLNGRQIFRDQGRLTLADGTLAGADIALIDALRYCHHTLGLPLEQVLRMGARLPAQAIGAADHGHLRCGARADFITIEPDLALKGVWIGGQPLEAQ